MEESKELPVVEQGQQLWGYDRQGLKVHIRDDNHVIQF